jgi:hypothetical protein
MINAIQDTVDHPNATVDTLRANLKAWNSTYVKNGIGIVTKVDNAVEDYVKTKLMKLGRLDAPPKSDTPTTTTTPAP